MGLLFGTADTIIVNVSTKITLDLGKTKSLKFTAKFKARGYDDGLEISGKVANDDFPDITPASVVYDDLISWDGLEGEGGEVEFNPDNLAAVLDHPEYLQALFDAWGRAQLRRVITNQKN